MRVRGGGKLKNMTGIIEKYCRQKSTEEADTDIRNY